MKTIFYFTDTHLNETTPGEHRADAHKNWEEILTEITLKPDELIFGGDIGSFSAYPAFFEALSDYKLRVIPGNHDTSAHVRLFFPDEPHSESGFYQDTETENLKWLFLDSSTNTISIEQMEWLKNKLATTHKEVILFIHHPILAVDSVVDKKYPLENREAIKDLLLRHQKQVSVFSGHYHIEDETSQGNIRQWVTPAVSYQIKKGTSEMQGDASYFSYRMIYVDQNRIDTEVINLYPEDF